MASVTVQFSPSDRTQSQLFTALKRVLDKLGLTPITQEVQPVFPGETNPQWMGTFVVTVSGQPDVVAGALQNEPDIESAYVAPQRTSIRSRAA